MELTEFKDSGYFPVYCCRREPIEKRQQKGKKKHTHTHTHPPTHTRKRAHPQRRASLKTVNIVNGCSVF